VAPQPSNYPLFIGQAPVGGSNFSGVIDEVTLYKRALTGNEIIEIFEAGSAGKSMPNGCVDTYTMKRVWTALDACGNRTRQTQTITVQDTKAPVLTNVPKDVSVQCADEIPPSPPPTATDNCDGDVLIVPKEVVTFGSCPNDLVVTRTWTAWDNCGNNTLGTQVITVKDTIPPVLSGVPRDVSVECAADVPRPAQPTATDNCDGALRVQYNEVITPGTCPNDFVVTRTWTATDSCGNATTRTQVITVKDTTPPVLTGVPEDEEVQCAGKVPDPATPTATDNCDPPPTIEYVETRDDGPCPNNFTLTRTWTATDACGNKTTGTQVIKVNDTKPPVLEGVPEDITVQCAGRVPDPATPTATDNCGPAPTITFTETRTDGACPNHFTLTRTWTAKDACNNTTTATQTITVHDTKPPEFEDVPPDMTIECGAIPDPPEVEAFDNCDKDLEPTFEQSSEPIDGIISWWPMDEDTGEVTKDIVDDNDGLIRGALETDGKVDAALHFNGKDDHVIVPYEPNLDVPPDFAVEAWVKPLAGYGSVKDGHIDIVSRWGNVGAGLASFLLGLDENGFVLFWTYDGITASMLASINPIPTGSWSHLVGIRDGTTLRIYINGVQDNFLDGSVAPQASGYPLFIGQAPAGGSNFKGIIDEVTLYGVALGADDVGDIYGAGSAGKSIPLDGALVGCEFNYRLKRVWTATDSCGNTGSATQIITVQDVTPPVFEGVPPDVTVNCETIPAPGQPTATDNCDDSVDITYAETRTDGVPNRFSYILTRTWTATDDCGNAATATQIITVLGWAYGDVNGDCRVNTADALLMMQQIVGLRSCDDPIFVAACCNFDVNCDGVGGLGDVLLILQVQVRLRACDDPVFCHNTLCNPVCETPDGLRANSRGFAASNRTASIKTGEITGNLTAGELVTMPVTINATGSLGAYLMELTYDPSVLKIEDISGGAAPEFSAKPVSNTAGFTTGQTLFAAVNVKSLDSPGANVNVAVVTFRVLKSVGNEGTTVVLKPVSLQDTNGLDIQAAGSSTTKLGAAKELTRIRDDKSTTGSDTGSTDNTPGELRTRRPVQPR
jgi:hypothetical protein